ncbi:FHA domain-containing protein, partial [Chloroflexota bacterium]
ACNLRLSDPSVSRLHTKLRFAADNWYLQDQGSQTGSFMNDQKVDSTIINHRDRIQIGDNLFEFQIGS